MAAAGTMLVACHNQDTDFGDFDYSTVYFPYQAPVRTIVLGNSDVVDLTNDNAHVCEIYAVIGGTREGRSATVNFSVDNSLVNNLVLADGSSVKVMPASYYTLADSKINIDGINGSVKVQLNDAFFNDTLCTQQTYVIPLVINSATGVDSVLRGQSLVSNPVRTRSTDWNTQPMDYVMYMVKFVCPWAGNYLRRGTDNITTANTAYTYVRHADYIESDEVTALTTKSINKVTFNYNSNVKLLITFDADKGTGTISSLTEGVTATGTATFVEDGATKAWGNLDRDVIYMNYTMKEEGTTIVTNDTLVARDRGVSGTAEEFTYTYQED